MHIGIEKPCSEDWKKMTATEKGALCDKCQKEVIDFSSWKTVDIRSELLSRKTEEVCGRMTQSQLVKLNLEFEEFKFRNQRSFQVAFLFSLVVAFGLSLFSCQDSDQERTVQNLVKNIELVESNNVDDDKNGLENAENFLIDSLKFQSLQEMHEIKELPLVNYKSEIMISGGVGYDANYQEFMEKENIVKEVKMGKMVIRNEVVKEIIPNDVRESIIEPDLLVFPNPTSSNSNVKVIFPRDEFVIIQLFNVSGKFIQTIYEGKTSETDMEFNILMDSLESGTYLVTMKGEKISKTERIIKM